MSSRGFSTWIWPAFFVALAGGILAGCEGDDGGTTTEPTPDTPVFGGAPGGGTGGGFAGEPGGAGGEPDVPEDPGSEPEPEPDVPEETVEDAGPDVPDTPHEPDAPDEPDVPAQPDGPCVPDCTDKVCGSDGCEGLCGYCTYPLVCDAEGQCVEVCVPECEGKFCGPDGCGGTCGQCEDELICGDDGLCYTPECEPDCAGKVCGPDGCGSDCGLCAEPKICTNGYCNLGPCGVVTSVGECQGNVAVWCEGGDTLIEQDCSLAEGYICAYDGFANKYVCMDEPECVPKCEGKVCGSDGCEGQCGACSSGWACEQGQCQPQPGAACGTVTSVGLCVDNTLWFCTGEVLYSIDCTLTGETCQWVPANAKFDCGS